MVHALVMGLGQPGHALVTTIRYPKQWRQKRRPQTGQTLVRT